NGFFVLAEFSLVKVRATRLEQLAEAGAGEAAHARLALGAITRLDDFLAATQLGITLASLALGWVGEPAFASLIQRGIASPGWLSPATAHGIAIPLAFVAITLLHMLFGELAPKFIGIQRSERAALATARPLNVFYRVF